MNTPFTPPEIREIFKYARMAHEKSEVEMSSLFGNSLTTIDPMIKGKGDICYIINEGERVVVAFPGSNDLWDWILNFFRFWKPKGGVHPGFSKALDAMEHRIRACLLELNPTQIDITGVSRGGGMSEAFMERFAKELRADINCITFAQPKVFTKQYFEQNGSVRSLPRVNYLRVYIESDPVKDTPPTRFGYTFNGPELGMGKKVPKWKQWLNGWKVHDTAVYQEYIDRLK